MYFFNINCDLFKYYRGSVFFFNCVRVVHVAPLSGQSFKLDGKSAKKREKFKLEPSAESN